MSDSWIWGRHPVLEALRAAPVEEVWIARNRSRVPILTEIQDVARARGVSLREVAPEDIQRTVGSQNTQGVIARVASRAPLDLEDLLERTEADGRARFFLVLDQIQDPHNLGALLRTADAAGVQGVIVPERRSAPLSGTVAKVSAGALHHLSIAEVPNLARGLDRLKEAGLWLVGLDGEGEESLFGVDLRVPIALLVGSEGSGLRRLTQEACDFVVRIPMLGTVGSLNAAVAGSIAMYEVVRQRGNGD